jgi:Putative beta-lactamase-inhibitor-like, PepSY-like
MKNSKSIKTLFIVLMMFYTNHIIAQGSKKNDIPSNVSTAFAAKYPKAEVKNWTADTTGIEYTATAKESHHKYYATFDKNGKWVETVTKYNWSWDLSPIVKKAFRKSKYGYWHVYSVNVVDSPSGQICKISVNNTNHPVDAYHQDVLPLEHLLIFKMNGDFVEERNITASL